VSVETHSATYREISMTIMNGFHQPLDAALMKIVITIQKAYPVPTHMVEPGISRGACALIFLGKYLYPFVSPCVVLEDRERFVGRTIINAYDLEIHITLAKDAFHALRKICFSVVNRQYESHKAVSRYGH
jgi:hypothetical protein